MTDYIQGELFRGKGVRFKPRVPALVDKAGTEVRTGGDQIALPDGVRPVEINTGEAGWGSHPDVPAYPAPPDQQTPDEYVVDLASFASPLGDRMEWMRQLQMKIPPPSPDYETVSLPAVHTSAEARAVARRTKLRE